jgi:hypothetical protein
MKNLLIGFSLFFSLIPSAIPMSGQNNAAGGVGGLVQAEKDAVIGIQSVTNNTKAMQLRTALTNLASAVMRVGNNTVQNYNNTDKVQKTMAAIDNVVNALGGAAITSSSSVLNNIRSDLQGYNIPGLFQPYQVAMNNQPQTVTSWDTYFYPVIATHIIRLQAAYATALINYISQNATNLNSSQLDAMLGSVNGLISGLNSIT